MHGCGRGLGCEFAAEGLGAGDDLVQRAQDDGVAGVLDDDFAALGKAVLFSQTGGEAEAAVRHDFGFHGVSPTDGIGMILCHMGRRTP